MQQPPFTSQDDRNEGSAPDVTNDILAANKSQNDALSELDNEVAQFFGESGSKPKRRPKIDLAEARTASAVLAARKAQRQQQGKAEAKAPEQVNLLDLVTADAPSASAANHVTASTLVAPQEIAQEIAQETAQSPQNQLAQDVATASFQGQALAQAVIDQAPTVQFATPQDQPTPPEPKGKTETKKKSLIKRIISFQEDKEDVLARIEAEAAEMEAKKAQALVPDIDLFALSDVEREIKKSAVKAEPTKVETENLLDNILVSHLNSAAPVDLASLANAPTAEVGPYLDVADDTDDLFDLRDPEQRHAQALADNSLAQAAQQAHLAQASYSQPQAEGLQPARQPGLLGLDDETAAEPQVRRSYKGAVTGNTQAAIDAAPVPLTAQDRASQVAQARAAARAAALEAANEPQMAQYLQQLDQVDYAQLEQMLDEQIAPEYHDYEINGKYLSAEGYQCYHLLRSYFELLQADQEAALAQYGLEPLTAQAAAGNKVSLSPEQVAQIAQAPALSQLSLLSATRFAGSDEGQGHLSAEHKLFDLRGLWEQERGLVAPTAAANAARGLRLLADSLEALPAALNLRALVSDGANSVTSRAKSQVSTTQVNPSQATTTTSANLSSGLDLTALGQSSVLHQPQLQALAKACADFSQHAQAPEWDQAAGLLGFLGLPTDSAELAQIHFLYHLLQSQVAQSTKDQHQAQLRHVEKLKLELFAPLVFKTYGIPLCLGSASCLGVEQKNAYCEVVEFLRPTGIYSAFTGECIRLLEPSATEQDKVLHAALVRHAEALQAAGLLSSELVVQALNAQLEQQGQAARQELAQQAKASAEAQGRKFTRHNPNLASRPLPNLLAMNAGSNSASATDSNLATRASASGTTSTSAQTPPGALATSAYKTQPSTNGYVAAQAAAEAAAQAPSSVLAGRLELPQFAQANPQVLKAPTANGEILIFSTGLVDSRDNPLFVDHQANWYGLQRTAAGLSIYKSEPKPESGFGLQVQGGEKKLVKKGAKIGLDRERVQALRARMRAKAKEEPAPETQPAAQARQADAELSVASAQAGAQVGQAPSASKPDKLTQNREASEPSVQTQTETVAEHIEATLGAESKAAEKVAQDVKAAGSQSQETGAEKIAEHVEGQVAEHIEGQASSSGEQLNPSALGTTTSQVARGTEEVSPRAQFGAKTESSGANSLSARVKRLRSQSDKGGEGGKFGKPEASASGTTKQQRLRLMQAQAHKSPQQQSTQDKAQSKRAKVKPGQTQPAKTAVEKRIQPAKLVRAISATGKPKLNLGSSELESLRNSMAAVRAQKATQALVSGKTALIDRLQALRTKSTKTKLDQVEAKAGQKQPTQPKLRQTAFVSAVAEAAVQNSVRLTAKPVSAQNQPALSSAQGQEILAVGQSQQALSTAQDQQTLAAAQVSGRRIPLKPPALPKLVVRPGHTASAVVVTAETATKLAQLETAPIAEKIEGVTTNAVTGLVTESSLESSAQGLPEVRQELGEALPTPEVAKTLTAIDSASTSADTTTEALGTASIGTLDLEIAPDTATTLGSSLGSSLGATLGAATSLSSATAFASVISQISVATPVIEAIASNLPPVAETKEPEDHSRKVSALLASDDKELAPAVEKVSALKRLAKTEASSFTADLQLLSERQEESATTDSDQELSQGQSQSTKAKLEDQANAAELEDKANAVESEDQANAAESENQANFAREDQANLTVELSADHLLDDLFADTSDKTHQAQIYATTYVSATLDAEEPLPEVVARTKSATDALPEKVAGAESLGQQTFSQQTLNQQTFNQQTQQESHPEEFNDLIDSLISDLEAADDDWENLVQVAALANTSLASLVEPFIEQPQADDFMHIDSYSYVATDSKSMLNLIADEDGQVDFDLVGVDEFEADVYQAGNGNYFQFMTDNTMRAYVGPLFDLSTLEFISHVGHQNQIRDYFNVSLPASESMFPRPAAENGYTPLVSEVSRMFDAHVEEAELYHQLSAASSEQSPFSEPDLYQADSSQGNQYPLGNQYALGNHYAQGNQYPLGNQYPQGNLYDLEEYKQYVSEQDQAGLSAQPQYDVASSGQYPAGQAAGAYGLVEDQYLAHGDMSYEKGYDYGYSQQSYAHADYPSDNPQAYPESVLGYPDSQGYSDSQNSPNAHTYLDAQGYTNAPDYEAGLEQGFDQRFAQGFNQGFDQGFDQRFAQPGTTPQWSGPTYNAQGYSSAYVWQQAQLAAQVPSWPQPANWLTAEEAKPMPWASQQAPFVASLHALLPPHQVLLEVGSEQSIFGLASQAPISCIYSENGYYIKMLQLLQSLEFNVIHGSIQHTIAAYGFTNTLLDGYQAYGLEPGNSLAHLNQEPFTKLQEDFNAGVLGREEPDLEMGLWLLVLLIYGDGMKWGRDGRYLGNVGATDYNSQVEQNLQGLCERLRRRQYALERSSLASLKLEVLAQEKPLVLMAPGYKVSGFHNLSQQRKKVRLLDSNPVYTSNFTRADERGVFERLGRFTGIGVPFVYLSWCTTADLEPEQQAELQAQMQNQGSANPLAQLALHLPNPPLHPELADFVAGFGLRVVALVPQGQTNLVALMITNF